LGGVSLGGADGEVTGTGSGRGFFATGGVTRGVVTGAALSIGTRSVAGGVETGVVSVPPGTGIGIADWDAMGRADALGVSTGFRGLSGAAVRGPRPGIPSTGR
jgi:hypothetical protein